MNQAALKNEAADNELPRCIGKGAVSGVTT